MQLNEHEQSILLKEFPRIELSYETNVHKKVYQSDFILAIPDGKKCFVWFTSYKNQNVCILLEVGDYKKIVRINMVYACFHNELSYKTVLYGTLFHHKSTQYLSIEDVFFYKGNNVSNYTYANKLMLFQTLFSREIKQVSYFQRQIIFGLPLISTNYTEIYNKIKLLPYKVKYIQFAYNTNKKYNIEYSQYDKAIQPQKQETTSTIHTNKNPNSHNNNTHNNNTYNNNNNTNTNKKVYKNPTIPVVFKVKADIQNDIYHLYYKDEQGFDSYYDVAYIPDYKTSVMMNSLFRNIKENRNLDALEESDDEEEFENERPDKFVFLEKEYAMIFTKNHKFNKWVPIQIAGKEHNITCKKNLSSYN
uniref:Uncharacterized protein n=1 Tax=viral metagenome TaxID=1070528 RepID=A0A6C0AZG9_9ZZZZ